MKFSKIALIVFTSVAGSVESFSGLDQRSVVKSAFHQSIRRAKKFPSSCLNRFPTRIRAEIEDDNDDFADSEDPLSNGVDSVAWLPTTIGAKDRTITGAQEGAEILPLFPLGGIVYIPNSEHVLNIFEPRYRQMYSDILMNGTKRFVVCMSHPSEKGRFAQMGVLFELEDLKEVSEQTNDQIKFICNHKVTGRVKIEKVLNPESWETRGTYLKVEGVIKDDSGQGEKEEAQVSALDTAKEEEAVKKYFLNLVDIQHDLEEDVRFTRASVASLAVKPGSGKDGLWQTISLWQSFADQRLMSRQNELQKDFQEKLQEFLRKDRGLKDEEIPSVVGFGELSPELKKDVQELQQRMSTELRPFYLESSLTMQKILEASNHFERCKLLKHFIVMETKRLQTKKALTGMFSGISSQSSDDDTPALLPQEQKLDEEPKLPSMGSNDDSIPDQGSIFIDDEDAFQ